MSLVLDGRSLSIDDVARASRPHDGSYVEVSLAPETRQNLSKTRAFIEREWMGDDAPRMYAFNTGVGALKDVRIPATEFDIFQEKMILAHATGIGAPFPEDTTRATLLLRANALASNFSGISVHVLERLIEFLNRGLHPVSCRRKGSVGASGDLAPLAHLAGALCGYREAAIIYEGERLAAPEALQRAGLPHELKLGAKDASALLNGSTVSLAVATLATERARRLVKHADIALALSLEAMRGEMAAFDSRLARARPHRGQIRTADNMRKILAGSERMSDASRALCFPEERRAPEAAPTPRVQDTYSMRCAPQVHGPVADALDYIEGIIGTELNSATDNPLMFENEQGGYQVLSGGHFHGQYIAQAMDLLAIAVTDLGSISERRVARLIDPSMSYGLPRNLSSGRLGVNTGFATVQCSLSALVMENRTLSMPGSVDSIPGKGNAEDHVSNSTWCARKAGTVVDNTEYIAGELLTAAQALDMVPEGASRFPIGRGSAAALSAVRATIPPVLDGDIWYATPMAAARELVRAGTILNAVEREVGALD